MTAPLPLRPAVAAGDLVAISGQVGHVDGTLVEGGVTEQTRKALENLVAVLADNGLTVSDVIKTNVFLLSMDDFGAMNAEYAQVFHTDPPARSAVAVHQLPIGAAVEIEAWAYRGSGS
ncbi:MAG: Rid family hydrolase [Nocardioidaceae bacterium]